MHGCRPITLDRGPDYFLAHRFDDSERESVMATSFQFGRVPDA